MPLTNYSIAMQYTDDSVSCATLNDRLCVLLTGRGKLCCTKPRKRKEKNRKKHTHRHTYWFHVNLRDEGIEEMALLTMKAQQPETQNPDKRRSLNPRHHRNTSTGFGKRCWDRRGAFFLETHTHACTHTHVFPPGGLISHLT